MSSEQPHFFVYAITFDQDVFGVFATREQAEASLAQQISEGGPGWPDCEVERLRVEGTPESRRLRVEGTPGLAPR